MKHPIATCIFGLVLGMVAGCSSQDWVTLDNGGCDSARTDKINDVSNQDDHSVMARSMGMSICAQAGKTFAGKFRCDGEQIQVACKA